MPSNSSTPTPKDVHGKTEPVTEADVTTENVEAYDPTNQPEAPEDDTRTYVGVPDGKGGWAHRVPTDEWSDYEKKNGLVA